MRLSALVVAVTMAATANAAAQRRSAADEMLDAQVYEVLGRNIASIAESAGRYAKSLAEANREIQEVRRRFWAEYDAGVRRGPAQQAFASALLAKDVAVMSTAVSGGTKNPTVTGLNSIFGEIDGGILAPARPAFEEWIDSIRFALGANRPNTVLFASQAQLLSAMEKTSRWYDVYREWRDYAEFRAHGIERPRPTIEAPGENALAATRPRETGPNEWPLAKEEIRDAKEPLSPLVRRRLAERGLSTMQMLECTYRRGAAVAPALQSIAPLQRYWYRTVFFTREELQKVPRTDASLWPLNNPITQFHTVALDACPKTEAEAWEAARREAPAAPTAAAAAKPAQPSLAPGTSLVVQIVEPINLMNSESSRYRARLGRAVQSGGITVPAGSEVVIRVDRKGRRDTGPNVVFAGLTVESISMNGTTMVVSTNEVSKPVPIPGTQYTGGAPALRAPILLYFSVVQPDQ